MAAASPRESGRGFRCCDCGAVNMAVSLRARSLRHLRIRGKGLRAGRGARLCPSPGSRSTPLPSSPLRPLFPFLLLGLLPPPQPNALLFPRPPQVATTAARRTSPSISAEVRAGGVGRRRLPLAAGRRRRGWGGEGQAGGERPGAAERPRGARWVVWGKAKREWAAGARRRCAVWRPVVSGATRRWKPLLSPRRLPCRGHRAGLPRPQARGAPACGQRLLGRFWGCFGGGRCWQTGLLAAAGPQRGRPRHAPRPRRRRSRRVGPCASGELRGGGGWSCLHPLSHIPGCPRAVWPPCWP